jgi:hypothetical protein
MQTAMPPSAHRETLERATSRNHVSASASLQQCITASLASAEFASRTDASVHPQYASAASGQAASSTDGRTVAECHSNDFVLQRRTEQPIVCVRLPSSPVRQSQTRFECERLHTCHF